MDFVMFFLFRFREMFRRASLAQHDTAGVSIYLGFPKVAGKLASVARLKRIVAIAFV